MHHRRGDNDSNEKICVADTRRGKGPVRGFLDAVTADPKDDGEEDRDSLGPLRLDSGSVTSQ